MARLRRIPDWIRFKIPGGGSYAAVKGVVNDLHLHTVCTEARCPNIGECLCAGTATFLVMGNVCTRNCRYCAVAKGVPAPFDDDEPRRIGEAVARLKLNFAVITSVTRDDLPDGGASIFARVIDEIRTQSSGTGIEVLVPDFLRSEPGSLDAVLEKRPGVFNHNIEVARPLYGTLRPQGDYRHSLNVLERAARAGLTVKSGLMAGFGETLDDIRDTLRDLRGAGCAALTAGQYLRSHKLAFPVAKYYRPEEFEEMRAMALEMGFAKAECGPLVRSSYHAAEMARRL